MGNTANNSSKKLHYTAKNMRRLLEAYKNNNISEIEKRILFKAIKACMEIRLEPAEKRYFEVIVNRYLLREPMMLSEIAEVYRILPETVSGWEAVKGFGLLASAVTRLNKEERLRKWVNGLDKKEPVRKRACKLWLISKKTLTPAEIGRSLGISNKLISKWKMKDRWVGLSEGYQVTIAVEN